MAMRQKLSGLEVIIVKDKTFAINSALQSRILNVQTSIYSLPEMCRGMSYKKTK